VDDSCRRILARLADHAEQSARELSAADGMEDDVATLTTISGFLRGALAGGLADDLVTEPRIHPPAVSGPEYDVGEARVR
jgi:hypothetical protein